MRPTLAACALVLICAGAGSAADMARIGDITIHDPWVRASLGNAPNSAAYMTLETTGDEADHLIGGETPVAERVELHTTTMEDGVARMRQVEAVEVAPGEPAVLEPGSFHVMLVDLTETLEEGATIPLTLTFEGAGSVELELPVRGLAGGMQGGGHGEHDGSSP